MSLIEYREVEGPIGRDLLLAIASVERDLLGSADPSGFSTEHCADQIQLAVNNHRWIHLGLATLDGEVVGYKLGRSNDPRTFESWGGGVHRDVRRQGVASALAQLQEIWCRAQSFQFIQTETAHDNHAMLAVNLKQGFVVAGTYLDRGAHLKVILQKPLN